MTRPETHGSAESTFDSWIKEIELCWKQIPEFTADPEKLRHLAVICDGNRRVAKERRDKTREEVALVIELFEETGSIKFAQDMVDSMAKDALKKFEE